MTSKPRSRPGPSLQYVNPMSTETHLPAPSVPRVG
jgi:hypothetical protein